MVNAQQPAELVSKKQIETIDVVGERPLSYFRNALHEKEELFFNAMNELVSDDDFKVKCRNTRRIFSHLKERKCEAKFVSRLMNEQAEEQFDLMGPSTRQNLSGAPPLIAMRDNKQIQKRINSRQKEYLEEAKKLINSNPELLKTYNELELAKLHYNAAKEQ